MSFTKHKVSQLEADITALASTNEVSPKVTSLLPVNNEPKLFHVDSEKNTITLELWPYVLIDLPQNEWILYKEPVVNCLKKLHSLGVVHGDLSEENIVVNPETKDAKIIDFGLSNYASNIDVEEFNRLRDFDAKSQDDLFRYDFLDIKLLFTEFNRLNNFDAAAREDPLQFLNIDYSFH